MNMKTLQPAESDKRKVVDFFYEIENAGVDAEDVEC